MPFYVNDWFSSPRVQCMTPAQELGYFRLLAFCWASQDASLPDDDQRLSVMSRMGEGWFNGGSKVVRECFKQHPTKEGHLTNQRVFELWRERQEWRDKSAKGGRKSGQTRKLKKTKGGSRVVEPKGNSSSSSSSSSSDIYSDANASVSADADACSESVFISKWNETPGVVAVRGERLSAKRQTAFRNRLASKHWWSDFLACLSRFPLPFVTSGRSGTWRPDADWILKPDTVNKILEGKYHGGQNMSTAEMLGIEVTDDES